jgi:hypothetical protein
VKSFHVNVNACQIYMAYSQQSRQSHNFRYVKCQDNAQLVFAARCTCERERRVVSWEISRREGWVLVDCSKGLRGGF